MKKQERSFMRLKIYPKKAMIIKNMAILYRTNAQSRVFEEGFMIKNIPYRIVGGTNFYQRKRSERYFELLKKLLIMGWMIWQCEGSSMFQDEGSVQQQSRRSMCMQLSIILVF